jgi:hypothetical protein
MAADTTLGAIEFWRTFSFALVGRLGDRLGVGVIELPTPMPLDKFNTRCRFRFTAGRAPPAPQ